MIKRDRRLQKDSLIKELLVLLFTQIIRKKGGGANIPATPGIRPGENEGGNLSVTFELDWWSTELGEPV